MTIQPLIAVLGDMLRLYEELLAIADLKKDAIIQNRTNDLSRLTNQESRHLKKLNEMESEREVLVKEYFAAVGIAANPGRTLTELAQIVCKIEEKQELMEIRRRLTETLSRLKEKNQLNAKLIENSLQYIEFTLDILMPSDDNGYDNPNSSPSRTGNQRGIFEARA